MKIYRNRSSNSNKVSPIYLLPNIFTLGAMFAGFYAIVQSINGEFINSGIATFFAMLLDSMDGRVARLTHTSSPFGAELDSLSDMVSFGIAPSVIIFNWQLHKFGKLGWLVAFIFCACAGLRLARFNTMLQVSDKKYFTGMPSPSAAALVIGYVYMCVRYSLDSNFFGVTAAVVTLVAALSMVSNVKFYSFKELHVQHKARFSVLLMFLLILAFLIVFPEFVIYGFFVFYAFISYFMYIFRITYKSKKFS